MKSIPYLQLQEGMYITYGNRVGKVISFGDDRAPSWARNREFFSIEDVKDKLKYTFKMREKTISVMEQDEIDSYLSLKNLGL